MSQSPVPWTWEPCETDGDDVAGAHLKDANGHSVFTVDCGDFDGLSDEMAERIVRCVNAHEALVSALKALVQPDDPLSLWVGGNPSVTNRVVQQALDALKLAGEA